LYSASGKELFSSRLMVLLLTMSYNNQEITRLNIPAYGWWNEALHGVAFSGRATVFPQPIGLAASWNKELLFNIGDAISDEARAKHHEFVRQEKRNNFQGLTYWAPNINIFRDPRWGRGIETYGEDPYLTGRMGVHFIKGLQGDDEKYFKLIATPKHYAVHSGPEPERHRFNAVASDKDLYETYLPHFREAIQEGGAYSIMSAYNRFNGESCSAHPRLLNEILREEWGFEGVVVSDCGAVRDIFEYHKIVDSKEEAAAIALVSGCDLNCGDYYQFLSGALEQNLITEEDIDVGLRRILLARFKLGMFDPEVEVPYASIPMETVNSKENQALALLAAKESLVLLKNDDELLPISDEIKNIAVIGPNANDIDVLLGNYNGRPFNITTPYQGIKNRAPEGVVVNYAPGTDLAKGVYMIEDLPDTFLFTTDSDGNRVQGLTGEYYNNKEWKGQPVTTQVDPSIKFDWQDGSAIKGMPNDDFSIRWSGKIKVPSSGTYKLGGEGHHGYKLYINDSLHVSDNAFYHINAKRIKEIQLEADTEYDIKIDYFAYSGDANFRLVWVPNDRQLEKDALELAEKSDMVIMIMGLSPRLEGEELGIYLDGFAGGDRSKLHLPQNQIDLIRNISSTGKPIVLVLLNGSALALNWENENIPAIVDAWYPGQAAGEAIASLLFGDYNPSGRLPITFYKSVKDLPPFEDYAMTNRTYRYFQGDPLYPFGYGLSFTQFKYGNFIIEDAAQLGDTVKLSVEITNIGDRDGSEVTQVYVTNNREDVDSDQPLRSLKAFEKTYLKAGETKTIHFKLTPDKFGFYDSEGAFNIEPGNFKITIGGGQPGYHNPTTETISTEVDIL
ncbi:MAG: glycoside hydrolase family 3 C-terminal domain-containing protein, partial [Bacteroidota bacterium]